MTHTTETKYAARVFHPGEQLLEELNERQLTQAEFSAIIDRPARTVNEIIKGKRGITPETAEVIAAALGTSADFWLGMQAEYDLFVLHKKHLNKTQEIQHRSELYTLFPVADLVRRRYIKPRKGVSELEQDVLSLLGLSSLNAFKNQVFAFYRTSEGSIVQSYLKAWVLLGMKLAERLKDIGKYNKNELLAFVPTIKSYSRKPTGASEVIERLNEFGVRVLILPHFSKTRVDGAACWLNNSHPVILLSLRYDRIDNFYFTLLHEIGHILLHESTKTPFVDTDVFRESDSREEKEANDFALKNLGLEGVLSDLKYQEITPTLLSRKSGQLNLHPALLIGHLQHNQVLGYNTYRKTLVSVRESIPTSIVQN